MHSDTRAVLSFDNYRTELRCPHAGCGLSAGTHVVSVHWEKDPEERDRKRVRMEVLCENGHSFVLVLKNHAGSSFFEWQAQTDIRSPFDRRLLSW